MICGTLLTGAILSEERNTHPLSVPQLDVNPLDDGNIFAQRYRIISEIGRGGMGRVFKAFDQELGLNVAIKVIRPEYLSDEHMVARFKNEILLSREVSHENVVRIYDFAEWQGLRYITMQLIDGVSLRRRLDESGPMEIEEIEGLAVQICAGLAAAHGRQIAHRDLKPQNILIDHQGHAFIADFGLARSAEKSEFSVTGIIMGTPEYISPEQWRGQRGDTRSDLYSLGVLLFEMATSRPLFKAETELGYFHKHLNETPSFTKTERNRLPDYLRHIILRCLAKYPDHRYQKPKEIVEDLLARRSSSIPLVQRFNGTLRKGRYLLTLVVLVVLLIFAYVHFRQSPVSDPTFPRTRIAVLPFENLTGEARFAFWSNTLADLLTTDLGQSRYLQLVPQAQLQPILLNRFNGAASTREQVEEIRGLTRADFIVSGKYEKINRTFQVTVNVMSGHSEEGVKSFFSEGLGEDSFFSIIDVMTENTKKAMKIPQEVILQDFDKDIRSISTYSIDALRLYSTAVELYHQKMLKESFEKIEKAIEVDNEFTMAYAFAARLLGVLKDKRSTGFYEQALKRLDHVSLRERLMIQGQYQNLCMGNWTQSLQYYQELLNSYPDDEDALHAIAFMNRNMENWDESTQAYLKLEEMMPGRILIQANLYFNEYKQGHYDSALEILEKHRVPIMKMNVYHNNRLRIFLEKSEWDQAKIEVDSVKNDEQGLQYQSSLLGDYYLLVGMMEQAEGYYTQLLDDKQDKTDQIVGLNKRFNLHLHKGNLKSARTFIEEIAKKLGVLDDDSVIHVFPEQSYYSALFDYSMEREKLQQEMIHQFRSQKDVEDENVIVIKREYLIGRLSILLNDDQELEISLSNMEKIVPLIGKAFARFPLHVRSEAALKAGKIAEAEAFHQEARLLFPNPRRPEEMAGDFLQTLARIQTADGRNAQAIEIYQDIITNNIGRLENAAAWVMAHVELARLHQKKGNPTEAKALAEKVIGWWGDGDLAPQVVAEMRRIRGK